MIIWKFKASSKSCDKFPLIRLFMQIWNCFKIFHFHQGKRILQNFNQNSNWTWCCFPWYLPQIVYRFLNILNWRVELTSNFKIFLLNFDFSLKTLKKNSNLKKIGIFSWKYTSKVYLSKLCSPGTLNYFFSRETGSPFNTFE